MHFKFHLENEHTISQSYWWSNYQNQNTIKNLFFLIPRLRYDDWRHHNVCQRLRLHRQLPAHERAHRLWPPEPREDHMTRGGRPQNACRHSGERVQKRQVKVGGADSVNTKPVCLCERQKGTEGKGRSLLAVIIISRPIMCSSESKSRLIDEPKDAFQCPLLLHWQSDVALREARDITDIPVLYSASMNWSH